MKSALVFLSLLAVATAYVIVPAPMPPCPNGYLLQNPDPTVFSTADFLPDFFHYNVPPLDLKSGTPRGPYFQLNSDSVWFINGSFHASMNLYAEPAYIHLIGTATLDSDAFFLGNAPANYTFGQLTVVTNINATLAAPYLPSAPANSLQNKNWFSQTAMIGFRARQEGTTTYGPNTVHWEHNALIMRLWGSSGYVASTDSFSASGRGVGFDLWAELVCQNPQEIIPPGICPDAPSDSFTLSYASSRGGQITEKSTTGTALSISFSA